MNAMILAAGLGTRLGAMGAATPKILIEVGGRPLLERHLDYLSESGMRRVVINVHHHAGAVQDFVAEYDGPLEVVCIHEERLLGTAGGVRNALAHLQPGPFLVLYGDIIVRDPLHEMLELHRSSHAVATLAVHRADSAIGKGTVEIDEVGRVTRFAEKEANPPEGPALINSGIYVLDDRVLEPVAPGGFSDFGGELFPQMVENGAEIMAFQLGMPVIDIGTPEGLALANATLTRGSNRR